MFSIFFEKRANKDLYRIDLTMRTKILLQINAVLLKNPYPNGFNPKKLKNSLYLRFRVSDYRILYELINKKIIIYAIKHRREVYRGL